MVSFLCLLTALAAEPPAEASEAVPVRTMAGKRSREPLPALSVERGLVLPRGWFELAVAHSSGGGAHRQDLGLRYGLAPQLEIFGVIPVHEQVDIAIGDTRFGARLELLDSDLPTSSVAVELGLSGPSGPDLPQYSLQVPVPWTGFGATRQLGALVLGLHGRLALWTGEVRGMQRTLTTSAALQGGPLVLRAELDAIAFRRERDGRLRLGAEVHASRGLELGFVADLLIAGSGEALAIPQGGGGSRLGGVLRVHF